jgi:hypothetical protein
MNNQLIYPENKRKDIQKYLKSNPRYKLGWMIVFESRNLFNKRKEILRDIKVYNSYKNILTCAIEASNYELEMITDKSPNTLKQIWYIHPKLFEFYNKTVYGIENFVYEDKLPRVINLSLGPPANLLPLPYNTQEPIIRMVKFAGKNNTICVFAAGNEGPNINTLSPWGLSDESICVGSSNIDGSLLADFSSVGIPDDPIYKPTIVSNGIDCKIILDADTLKVSKEEYDNLPDNKKEISKNGTSFSCSEVTSIVAQIIHFLEGMNKDNRKGRFCQIYSHSLFNNQDERVTSKRLIGEILDDEGYSVAYPLNNYSPILIKQLLMDMAIYMKNYSPHEVGAGFVCRQLAINNFGTFGNILGTIEPICFDLYSSERLK